MVKKTDAGLIKRRFGKRVKALRGKKYTQNELGKHLNLSRWQIQRLEKGTLESALKHLFEIAAFFEIEPEMLVIGLDATSSAKEQDQFTILVRILTAQMTPIERRRVARLLSVIQDLKLMDQG